jgi:hypothetical protein
MLMYRPDNETINELKRLYESGQISTAEFEHQANALRDAVMPQPRHDLAPMQPNTLRIENGPEAGRTVSIGSDPASAAALRRVFVSGFSNGGIMSDLGETTERSPTLDYSKPTEVPGMGKGFQSKDGRAVYVPQPDGALRKVLLGYDRAASNRAASEDYNRRRGELELRRGEADLAHQQTQTELLRQPKAPAAPAGYRFRADGMALEAIPGGPADPATKAEKPMNDEQAKAAGYGQRAAAAHEVLDSVGQGGRVQPNLLKRAAAAVPVIGGGLETIANSIPEGLGGPNAGQQQVEQAQRNFINAVLRRESGAVISDAEFDNAAKQYFPQPGDSPEVIAQKRANREQTIQALADSAGSGRGNVLEALTRSARAKLIKDAREAIRKGAPAHRVKQELEAMGIKDPL